MEFTALSFWMFTGLAVLTAGVLAALQYLRVRPRQVRIITTLFWQQAVDQARARTLFKRFRYPRTYLLLLLASLLVLLALAKPVFTTQQPDRVIVLEAGLAMTATDQRIDKARALVRAEAASLGEERVAVITADPRPRLLKHFDESLVVLEERLAKVQAADAPVVREDVLQAARSLLADRDKGEIVLVSAQPVTTDDDKVRVLAAGEALDNAFILSAAFVPDPTDLTRGAFLCSVGFTGKEAGMVTIKVGRPNTVLLEETVEFQPGDMKEFTVSGIAASGSILTASVSGRDAITGDNQIDFQLPDRRRIRVIPANGIELPPVLASVLESLPEVTTEAVDGARLPVIRIGRAGSVAEVLIHPSTADGELMAIHPSGHPLLGDLAFEDAICRAPATPLNAADDHLPLLLVGGSPVASLNPDATQLTISGTLFDEDASLVRRTGYMVFWSNMLQHLAGWNSEPLTLSPMQAKRSTDASSTALALKAGMGNFNLADGADASTTDNIGGVRFPAWQWLLTVALVLMSIEAVLNIRGKIS